MLTPTPGGVPRSIARHRALKTESYMQRQHEVGIMGMEFANTKELYNKQQKDNLALGIGNWVAAWMAGSNPVSNDGDPG